MWSEKGTKERGGERQGERQTRGGGSAVKGLEKVPMAAEADDVKKS